MRLLLQALFSASASAFSCLPSPIVGKAAYRGAAGPLPLLQMSLAEKDPRLEAYIRRQAAVETKGSREAQALLNACNGLERGLAASPEAASHVNAAVAAFEAAVPCKLEGDALLSTLSGRWELVYSSALVRPRGGRKSLRNDMLAATSPQLGDYFQTFSGRQLVEEVTVSLPAPFPLPRPEVCLVSKSVVEGVRFWPGKYASDGMEIDVFGPGGPRQRVRLPSPRRVLDQIFSVTEAVLPLELTLLKELEPRGGIGARREFTCTAGLFRGDPSQRVRVLRSVRERDGAYGEMRIFVWRDESGASAATGTGARATAGAAGGGDDALSNVGADAADAEWSSTEPVGMVDANGQPVEEFWTPSKGLGPDWGV